MQGIKDVVKSSREKETTESILKLISDLNDKGLKVKFGKIGNRTTYALVYDETHTIEYVGYTYLKDLKYYNENTGRLRALQQAIARMNTIEGKEE